ncbi:hypothetical protein ACI65C_007711 [Semiaphis heraclei]
MYQIKILKPHLLDQPFASLYLQVLLRLNVCHSNQWLLQMLKWSFGNEFKIKNSNYQILVTIQQQQRLIQMQRTVVPNRMIGSQQIIQQGTVQQTRQLAPPPPYPGPPPPYPGQHQRGKIRCLISLYLFKFQIFATWFIISML